MITGSVDRLDQSPDRVRFLFAFDAAQALSRPEVAAEFAAESARQVVDALAADLSAAARLDSREAFRAAAQRVRDRTGQKGRALFHPIRVALTGEPEGPELDLAVPAIDRGAEVPRAGGLAVPIVGCRERAAAFADGLETQEASNYIGVQRFKGSKVQGFRRFTRVHEVQEVLNPGEPGTSEPLNL